jgi:hypothetical protein
VRLIGLHVHMMPPDASSTHGSRRLVTRSCFGGALLALAIGLSAQPCAAYDVMLHWTVPANAAGYRVHTGSRSRTYTRHRNVGPLAGSTLNGVVSYLYQGFPVGPAVYVAVTAYNSAGTESDYSNEKVVNSGAPMPTPTAIKIGSGVLIRGNRRRPNTDRSGCQVEWIVVSSGNSADRFGLPSQSQSCQDGDPTCDFQPQTPGLCEFHVRACLNNADPNLPACTPGGIGTVDVRGPRPRAALGADAYAMLTGDVEALQNALNHLQDPRDSVAHSIYSPPLDPSQQGFCSGTFAIQAMVSNRARRPSVTLKTRSSDYTTLRRKISVSQLQLTCSPAAQ